MPTFPAPAPITAVLDQVAGSVHVVAGDRDDVVVTVLPANPGKPADARMAQETSVDFADVDDKDGYAYVVYTGPIDAYYGHRFGALPYRSLRFEHEHVADASRFQPVGTVNYPNDHAYTRITEFKHLTGQEHPGTSIVREYPQADGEPYYPVPREENEDLYKRYEALAQAETKVAFVGRLAQYRYYNMDQVVGAALAAARRLLA